MDQIQVIVQRPTLELALGQVPVSTDGSGITDGDKGDIVVSASGAVWAIDSAVLTTFGREVTSAADAAAARAALGVDAAWTYSRLGADVSDVTGSLVDSGLAFTPAASKFYLAEAFLVFTSAAVTTGLQWTFAAPGGATWSAQNIQVPNSITAQAVRFGQLDVIVNGTAVSSAGVQYLALGSAMVAMGGSPSGQLKVQFQTEIAASAVTLLAGSFLRVREIT
jgi:hypothetical protein